MSKLRKRDLKQVDDRLLKGEALRKEILAHPKEYADRGPTEDVRSDILEFDRVAMTYKARQSPSFRKKELKVDE